MAVLAFASACATLSFLKATTPSRGTPKIEFQNALFDGEHLSGRLLVGAAGGPITIDARLTANSVVHVEGVFDCVTQEPLPFLMLDSITTEPRSSDLLTLGEGYWYGADLDFLVFAEEITKKPSPDCISARIVFRTEPVAERESVPAETTVRVMRTIRQGPTTPETDGGADAGVPEATVHTEDGGEAIDAGSAPEGAGLVLGTDGGPST